MVRRLVLDRISNILGNGLLALSWCQFSSCAQVSLNGGQSEAISCNIDESRAKLAKRDK
ncbi:hypothetical protein F442_08865 [Phytophthora nicotianae P10297]|uniref:Uncharacterized protein n=1 Tax=Phytophthora nicotianae P10297 TaxID=1317064 RepID=W2ZC36_PHYNI|nr:hypothetical protein F442_08865 [Phytophthora nicotianae P10297]